MGAALSLSVKASLLPPSSAGDIPAAITDSTVAKEKTACLLPGR